MDPSGQGAHARHGAEAPPAAHAEHAPADRAQARGLATTEEGLRFEAGADDRRGWREGALRVHLVGPDGHPVTSFEELHERRMHLIVVRRDWIAHVVRDELSWTIPMRAVVEGNRFHVDRKMATDMDSSRNDPSTIDASRAGTFPLGGELSVNRLGFGAMRIGGDPEEARAVLRRAVDLGVNLIDTADAYGPSERLIAEALHPYPEGLVIATKGGLRPGQNRWIDGRPEHLREAVEGKPPAAAARPHRPVPAASDRSQDAGRGPVRHACGAAPAGQGRPRGTLRGAGR